MSMLKKSKITLVGKSVCQSLPHGVISHALVNYPAEIMLLYYSPRLLLTSDFIASRNHIPTRHSRFIKKVLPQPVFYLFPLRFQLFMQFLFLRASYNPYTQTSYLQLTTTLTTVSWGLSNALSFFNFYFVLECS